MNENDEVEIDLVEMCKYFFSKWIIILAMIVMGAAVAAGFSIIFNKVVYTSEAKLYISVPKTSDKILIRDNANELVQDYIELLKSDLILEKVAKDTKLSTSEVEDSVVGTQVEGKRFLVITTQSFEKSKTKDISESVLKTLIDTITKVLKKDKPLIVEQSGEPTKSTTMNFKKNVILGAGVGFVIIFGVLFISFVVNSKKKNAK